MSLETGPFAESEEFQNKVLAQMLAVPHFCEVAKGALSTEDFGNKISQWFFNKLTTTNIPLTPTTLKEELLKEARSKLIEKDLVSKYVDLYRVVSNPPVPYESDYINQHMMGFIRLQACKRAVLSSIDLLKTGDFVELERRVVEAANAGADIMGSGLDYFGEYQARIARRAAREKERKLATGIPELDDLTYGGIKTKQLGLCVGGTGRGKSLFLQWLAKVAILLGKRVVYITFELSDEDMADRFDTMFAHIKPNALQDHSSQALRELSKYNKRFGSNLFIKEYPEDEVTIADIKAYLLQLTAVGFMPDLVLVDYVDLVKPHRVYNDMAQEQATVIKALRGIAKSLNTRIWTACQLNRGGLSMETPDESSIAGGISRLFTCDIAIFMAQTLEEREDELMRLIVSKNRNGRSGRTIKLDTEYEFLTFYRDPPAAPKDETNDETSSTDTSVSGKDVSDGTGDVLLL
jgi:replicative DNA helicase